MHVCFTLETRGFSLAKRKKEKKGKFDLIEIDMENLLERITLNPNVCHGKPTIRNLRYPVESMLELMASGMTIDDLLADYPDLEKEDFMACLYYAARLTQVKSIYRLAS